MKRRAFLAGSLGLIATPLAAEAEEAGKVYRIGYLSPGLSTASSPLREAFRQGLRDLGWVEGRNIVIDYRFSEGRPDRLRDLAAELVRLNVDVIVTGGTQAGVAVRNATGTIPIVVIGVGDFVGTGLGESLAHPRGNVTGLAYSVGLDIFGKQLALLKETVPKVRRVAILSNPANPSHPLWTADAKVAAQSLGIQPQLLEALGLDGFDGAFAAMAKERAGALLIVTDAMFTQHVTRLAQLAVRNRLPAAYGAREYVEAGGLMSYGPIFSDLWRRAAGYVDKILKGAKPGELPVEQPTKFELLINLKTANALGLTIPPAVLARADEVIQ